MDTQVNDTPVVDTQVDDYSSYFAQHKRARTLCYVCLILCGVRLILGLTTLILSLVPTPGPLLLIAFAVMIICFAAKLVITGAAITVYVFSVIKNVKLIKQVSKLNLPPQNNMLHPLLIANRKNRRLSKLTGMVLVLPLWIYLVLLNPLEFVIWFL